MESLHTFHIPVMGTGHSADTPIRVAPFGISSVISLVDDVLLKQIGRYYCSQYNLPFRKIMPEETDGRAKRITSYLETVQEIVRIKMAKIRALPFGAANDKTKYFDLLPPESPLKRDYCKLLSLTNGPEKEALEDNLTERMRPGSIDVNIMVKLDRINVDRQGHPLSGEYSDGKAALRGYAQSSLSSNIILSAGMNQSLFNHMTQFRDFYRDESGYAKKRIIIKVSDFRSALIQGKVLAKKGLEVHEFRIESGLNCGGHAFATNGYLLPVILREFKEHKKDLTEELRPMVLRHYEKMGWHYPAAINHRPLVTVQGGIGTHGEVRRLREYFQMDMTGWASPFLLVPEATPVDNPTRELVRRARENDLYLSDVSPLGVLFNNLRRTGSEEWTRERVEAGKPGSPCYKGFIAFNTELTEQPVCLASRAYQKKKLEEIDGQPVSEEEKGHLRAKVVEKTCLCHQLGNGALIALGIVPEQGHPQAICPGPNIAWFNRIYSLREMVDHIYGRGPSLVPPERPHMFAKEIVMYVDYFEKQVRSSKDVKALKEFKENLENGMDYCSDIAREEPYPEENLDSILPCVEIQRARLNTLYDGVLKSISIIEQPVVRL